MKKYSIKKVMVTLIKMLRQRLITKEVMDNLCKPIERRTLSVSNSFETRLESIHFGDNQKSSINDDLEKLFENIQLGEKPDEEAETYFLPRLTEHELELVEQKDEAFMKTLYVEMEAHAHGCEISAFKSDSKYVHGWGRRKTFTIEN